MKRRSTSSTCSRTRPAAMSCRRKRWRSGSTNATPSTVTSRRSATPTSTLTRKRFAKMLTDALASVSIFAKRFLVNVDVGVAERREVTVDGVALVLPLLHLFRRQLIAAGRVREHVDDVLRRFI